MNFNTESFKSEIKKNIASAEFELWFKKTDFEISGSAEDLKVTVYTPAIYVKDNLKSKYIGLLKTCFNNLYNTADIWFEFKVDLSRFNKLELESAPVIEPQKTDSNGNIGNFSTNNLVPFNTFENFVIGDNNQFARAAAWAVATNPGKQFNPLFIYSNPGLGKTHLMHAIGHYIIQNHKNLKVLYITSDEFIYQYVNAITQKKMDVFREKISSIDVLLIDDIQFLKDKEETQQFFFHTFNALHSSGKQVVITSDKPPKELSSFEERLRSRMECGLQADIQQPRYETRLAILKKLNERNNANLSDKILNFVAEHFNKDVREIEGAFLKVHMFSKTCAETEIDLAQCRTLFKDTIKDEHNIIKNVPISLIIREVASVTNIDFDSILSNKRDHPIALARQLAMYMCKEISDYPYKYIGKEFGKDHSTVIHSYNKIQELLENDNSLIQTIDQIKKKIYNTIH